MSDETTKTVLITGTSSGIGAASVDALAEAGWRVLAGVRDEADAPSAPGSAVPVVPVVLDVTSPDSIAAAVERVGVETGGRLDALVNNAGIPGAGPVETISPDTFRAVIETNLIGQFAVTQAFLPQLRQASGRIVFMSSLGGRVAFPYASPYHASKWGIEGFAESLRAEMAPLEVDVVVIEPASMVSEIWEKGRSSLAESRSRMTEEQRSVYGEALAGFDEQLAAQEDSEDPAEVAEQVLEALTTGSPSDRYLVGKGAGTLTMLRSLVPQAVFDRVSQRLAGKGG